ncbi:hypothetical protein HYU07_07135 [Candidatus Woesearchaeota archaeon]|nr:hypothetical protein [Candidatus Woesearchaeota archaeon]
MKKIEEFSKFIDDNKGYLAAIGVFAALTKYFSFTSPIDDFTKLILKDNVLPGITFLLFIFLSTTFIIHIWYDKRSENNRYLFIFKLLFSVFTVIIIGYFITFYGDWVKIGIIIILFFAVLGFLGNLLFKCLVKLLKNFWSNLIWLLIELSIIYLLNILQPLITDYYLLLGIFAPLYILISLSVFLSIFNLIKMIKDFIIKKMSKIKII